MLINELCKATGLTKKAIYYYEQNGILNPEVMENGYRIYTQEDMAVLKQVSVLRKLGLNLKDIKAVLQSENKSEVLTRIKTGFDLSIERAKIQSRIMQQLIDSDYDVEYAMESIEKLLDENTVIVEKLKMCFPGKLGEFLSAHFGHFLNSKIDTTEKAVAFRNITAFFDDMENFDIPQDLLKFYDNTFEKIEVSQIASHNSEITKDYDSFMNKYENSITEYIDYLKTEEYRQSEIYKIKKLFKNFCETSGYYDIFIPNLKILSPTYTKYIEDMTVLNDKILSENPEYKEIDF